MKPVTIADAPAFLNTNDKAMWVLGYNAAVERAQADEKPWPLTGCTGPLSDCDMEDAPGVTAPRVGRGSAGEALQAIVEWAADSVKEDQRG
jgi:hypothetical protein